MSDSPLLGFCSQVSQRLSILLPYFTLFQLINGHHLCHWRSAETIAIITDRPLKIEKNKPDGPQKVSSFHEPIQRNKMQRLKIVTIATELSGK
jgi:hypothetical protein